MAFRHGEIFVAMARRTVCVYQPNLQTTRFLRNNPDLRTRPRPSDSIDQFDSYAWHQVRTKLDHKFEAPFFKVTPEPGLQRHVNYNQTRRDVISRPFPEEHDLRLLRRALFPGRY